MVGFDSRDELMTAIIAMLMKRADSRIMLLVESDSGSIEIMQSEKSFIWSFGILAGAEKMLDEQYRLLMDEARNRMMEQQADAEMLAAVESSKKGHN